MKEQNKQYRENQMKLLSFNRAMNDTFKGFRERDREENKEDASMSRDYTAARDTTPVGLDLSPAGRDVTPGGREG